MSENPVVVRDHYERKSAPKYSTKSFKYSFNTSEKERLRVNLSP